MKTVAVIPARLQSARFPKKLLSKINGKRIIDHVIENTKKLNFIDDIVIGSDDEKFAKQLCKKYKFIKEYHISDACCGSQRAYNFYMKDEGYDFYLSIPADEPAINPDEVNKVFDKGTKIYTDEIITFYTKFYCNEDLTSPLSCKIVSCDRNFMLYNSRTVVPVNKDGTYLNLEQYKKHVGIFVFPKNVFREYGNLWNNTTDIESLEQNRFMQRFIHVRMIEMHHIGFGIDAPQQIKKLEDRLNEENRNRRNSK
jgi:3-deoxy-manno-octulosonate cytidylyltransferase (CMP-KDO synthetase)